MSSTKYIFFDIDGTLLDSNGFIYDSAKETLKMLQSNGHKIFINTGRAIKLIPDILKSLNFDGYVAGTGSYVEYHNKTIFEKYFNKEQTDSIINLLHSNNIPFTVSASDSLFGPKSSIAFFIEQFTHGKIKAEEVDDLSVIEDPFFDSIKPISIDEDIDNYYYNHPQIADMVFIKSSLTIDQLRKSVGPDIRIEKASFKSPDNTSGEITLANYSKATGIQAILDYFSADIKDSIAIGDGFNDLDMLKYAGTSIAMGNSPKDIKEVSDFITDDIDKDGVYKAFKTINLI